MAVCNLFNPLSKETGNFLMFQQYVDDLTKAMSTDGTYKVIPSKFVVCDIDYTKGMTLPSPTDDLNKSIPLFLQDYVENGLAYWINHKNDKYTENIQNPETGNILHKKGEYKYPTLLNKNNSIIFKSIFLDGLINQSKILNFNEIRYIGDINIQSYDEYNGMGYSEIYCYIPSESPQNNYPYILTSDDQSIVNENNEIEGYNIKISNVSKTYFLNRNIIKEEGKDITSVKTNKYTFNTIIVLYDIYNGDDSKASISNIPLGIYFTGKFNDKKQLTNPVTKFVTNSTIYDSGTSYGLRICTRFTATPNSDTLKTTEIELSNDNYSAFCQAMTENVKCINKMEDIVKESANQYNFFKETLSIIRNNRVNVPYIKEINGQKYWFINGRYTEAIADPNVNYMEPYENDDIIERFENQ